MRNADFTVSTDRGGMYGAHDDGQCLMDAQPALF
jgi:hypothetical protein